MLDRMVQATVLHNHACRIARVRVLSKTILQLRNKQLLLVNTAEPVCLYRLMNHGGDHRMGQCRYVVDIAVRVWAWLVPIQIIVVHRMLHAGAAHWMFHPEWPRQWVVVITVRDCCIFRNHRHKYRERERETTRHTEEKIQDKILQQRHDAENEREREERRERELGPTRTRGVFNPVRAKRTQSCLAGLYSTFFCSYYYGLQITCRSFFAEKLELGLFTPPFLRCCKFPASSASKKPTSDVQT